MATIDDDIFNPQVARVRARLQAIGVDLSTLSNKDLLLQLAEQTRNQGGGLDSITDKFGEGFTNQYLDIVNAPEPGREGFLGGLKEIPEGIGRGYEGMKSTALGGLGLAAGTLGFEDAEASLMQSAAEAQQRASEYNPSISRASDVRWDNPAEVARFLAGGFGEALPSTVEAAGSFALGAGAGGLAGRAVVKSRLRETLKNVVKRKSASETADQAIKRTFSTAGMQLGLGTSSIGLGTGEIYTELYPYTQLDPSNKDYVSPDKAKSLSIGFGTLAGSLDLFSAGLQLNKIIGIGEEASAQYLKRLLYNLPEGVFVEGATEAAQEFINIAADKYARGRELTFAGEELEQMFDAGVLGALGGVQFSAAGAIRFGDSKDKSGDDLKSDNETELEQEQTLPQDFAMADEIDSALEEIEAKEEEDVKFKPGDPVAVFREGRKISGTVSTIDDNTAIIETKSKVGDKEVTSRVEVDLDTEGLFNDAFVPEEEDLPEVEEEEDVSIEDDEPAVVTEDFTYNEKTTKVEPQERKTLEKAIKAYESSASKNNGISSKSASPKKDFTEITGVNSQSKQGQKLLTQLKELNVLDANGNYSVPTARDAKIEEDNAKEQVRRNKKKVERLFGQVSEDGRKVKVPDPVGQKVKLNNSSEPYTITSYDADTGVMKAEQVNVKGGNITTRPIEIDATGAYDFQTGKRIGNVTKFTKRGKIGGVKQIYSGFQAGEDSNILFSEEAPEGGYIGGLGGIFTTEGQKTVLLQNPLVIDMKGGQVTEEDNQIAQRNLATDNDGVVFENVGPTRRSIIVTKNQDGIYETEDNAIRQEMSNLGYTANEIEEVFRPISEITGDDPIRPLIGTIVGNHQYEQSSRFVGSNIPREKLMEDVPEQTKKSQGGAIDDKYFDGDQFNAIRWAFDHKRPLFTGKAVTTFSQVQSNNLGTTETFDFDPDAEYEYEQRSGQYQKIDASTPEEFEDALFNKRPKGVKRIFKNRRQATGGYYEFRSEEYGKVFTIGDVEFTKPIPEEKNAYLPLLEKSLESEEVTILSVDNKISPSMTKGDEGKVLVILRADKTRNGLEEGNIRITQLDDKGNRVFDSVKRNKDNSIPANRNSVVADMEDYTMIGQIKLFTPHSDRIDLMYNNIGEFTSDPEVQAVAAYNRTEDKFVPKLSVPKVSGGRGKRLKESFSAIQQIERLQREKPKNYKKRINELSQILSELQVEKIIIRDTSTGAIESLLNLLNTKFSVQNGLIEADLKDVLSIYNQLEPELQQRITDILNKGEGSTEVTFFTDLLDNTDVSDKEVKEEIRSLGKEAKFQDVDKELLYLALRNSPKVGDTISRYSEIHRRLIGYQTQDQDYVKTVVGGVENLMSNIEQIREDLGLRKIESGLEKYSLDLLGNVTRSEEMQQLKKIIRSESVAAYQELVQEGVIIPSPTEQRTYIEWTKFEIGSPEYNDWVEFSKKNPLRKEKSYSIPAINSRPAEKFINSIAKKFEEVIIYSSTAEDMAEKRDQAMARQDILDAIKRGDSDNLQFKSLFLDYFKHYTESPKSISKIDAQDMFEIVDDANTFESILGRDIKDQISRLISEITNSDELIGFVKDYSNVMVGTGFSQIRKQIMESLAKAYGIPLGDQKIWKVGPSKQSRSKKRKGTDDKLIIAETKIKALDQYRMDKGLDMFDTNVRATPMTRMSSIYGDYNTKLFVNNLASMFSNGPLIYTAESNQTLPNMRTMPKGFVDITTGREMEHPTTPLNEEDIERDRSRRRKQIGAVALPREHPLILSGNEEQLADAKNAMERFMESRERIRVGSPLTNTMGPHIKHGIYTTRNFTAKLALKRILEMPKANKATKFWAQALQRNNSDLINNMTIQFVNWSDFRKYATTKEDQISTAVYIPSENKILVSDLYYDNLDVSADEQLAGVLMHEIIHAPTKLAMDIGYAKANGHSLETFASMAQIKDLAVDEDTLGRIYTNLNNVVLPELREKLGNADYVHGLSSVDEFWSEVASNPKFRRALSKTRFSEQTRKKLGISRSWISNAWDYIKAILARIFGLETSTESLKWANEQLDAIINMAQELTPMREVLNDLNARGTGQLHMLGGKGAIQALGAEYSFEWFDGTTRVLIDPTNMRMQGSILHDGTDLIDLKSGDKLPDDNFTLGTLIDWPELFQSYPELESMPVIFKDMEALGSYGGGVIKIRKGTKDSPMLIGSRLEPDGHFATDIDMDTLKEYGIDSAAKRDAYSAYLTRTLVHEIQHAVDKIDGNPGGFNEESLRYLMPGLEDTAAFKQFREINNIGKINPNMGAHMILLATRYKDIQKVLDQGNLTYGYTLLPHERSALKELFENLRKISALASISGRVISADRKNMHPDLASLVYNHKAGEVTSQASEEIFDASSSSEYSERLEEYKNGIAEGKAMRHPALDFQGMMADNAWRLDYRLFPVLREVFSKAGSNLAEMFSTQFEHIYKFNHASLKAVPTPDASERVFQEGDVAAINEVVTLLSRAYNNLAAKGMVTESPEDFINKYAPGKVGNEKYYKRISQGIEDPQSIRIGDQGRNQVTRTHATNQAIDLISMMLRGRKQKVPGILDRLDYAESQIKDTDQQIEEFNEMFKDVQKRGLASPEDIAKTVTISMKKLTREQIEDIAKLVKKPIRKTAMDLDGVTSRDVGKILSKVTDIDTFDDFNPQEMNDAIENLNDPKFSKDTPESKYLRMAIVKVLQTQKDSSLFLYRMSTDKLGEGAERTKLLRDINKIFTATRADLTSDGFSYESSLEKRLNGLKKKRLKLLDLVDFQTLLQKEKVMLKELHNSINPRYKRLRAAMGELEPTNVGDGEPILVMRLNRDADGKPTGGYTKKTMVISLDKNGAIDNPDFNKAISETLMFSRDPVNVQKYGDQPWFRNMARNAQVALMDPTGGLKDKYFTQRKNWHLGSLESVGQAMGRFGPAGKKIAGLITQVIGQTRDLQSKVKAYSISANRAFVRVSKELGLDGPSLYTEVWQDMAFWFDNHPEYYGQEEEAFSQMWKWMREERPMHLENVKDMNRARDAVRFWVQKEIEAKNYMRYVNEEILGNRIRDDEVTVQSELDGSQVDFYRRPIDLGFSTWSRTLNNHAISSVVLMMRNKLKEDSNSDRNRIKLLENLANSAAENDLETVTEMYNLLYGDPQVVKEFVEPFLLGGVRRSAFSGPDNAPVGNSQFALAWKESGGDMITFLDNIFDNFSDTDGLDAEQVEKSKFEWYASFSKQLDARYKRLVRADNQVANEAHNVMKASEAIKNTPRSLDSRQIESKLPKKFFYYDIHDEVSTQIRLAMMVATSVFGRNGMKINDVGQGFYDKMGGRASTFNNVMTIATRGVHEAPQMFYSNAVKRDAYKILERDYGEKDGKLAFERLYSDAVTYREFGKVFDQLGQYYGKGNISGAYGDANVLLELLGTQSLMVLDNPKSSFWQTLALGEFPMAFRGLNRMSGKATGAALANMFNQSFGGIIEAFGYNLPKTSRIARSLNSTHFRTEEMNLSLQELLTQVGPNGEMVSGTKMNSFKKGIRNVKNAIAHSRRLNPDGTRQSFDAFTLFTGLFPWANGIINHSVGVGTAMAYEAEILRIAKFIEEKGLDIMEPIEFTAEQLGMNNSKTAEMVIGERDGWNNMNNMLLENGTSSMSRLAYDFLQRKQINPDAPVLEHNTVLMMNQVGMSNVSGEGFNAKIPLLYNNGLMRYAGIFLGWPIWKMAQTNRFIGREAGDELGTYMAFLKYLGLVSAVYMPLGLSAAFLVDWYDEEIVGKPNNLPPLTPWAMMPVFGPLFAMSNEESTIYAVTSRLARAGNVYGMGFEVANSMFATGDPFGAAKEFSLDSRLFMFNTFRNVRDALGTWYHQGEADYGNVIRPMLYGLGLGSVIQQMDVVSNLMDLDIEERRVADYLTAKNLIKKSAWVMGLPLTPPAKGYGKPSPVSVNLRQMERAAYANDKAEFFRQYQEAISAAKVYIEENKINTTPEDYIHERFRQRNIRYGITKGRISDQDWKRILEIQDEDDRVMLENYIDLHEFYLNQIGTSRNTSALPSMSQLRRMALLGVPIRY